MNSGSSPCAPRYFDDASLPPGSKLWLPKSELPPDSLAYSGTFAGFSDHLA